MAIALRVANVEADILQAAAVCQNGNGLRMQFRFLNYKQSSQCRKQGDSSVSYAAGSLITL